MQGDLLERPGGSGRVEHAVLALVRTGRWLQGLEASLLEGVPPVLQGAHGVVIAVFIRPGAQGSLAQGRRQALAAARLIFEEVDGPETGQGQVLGFGIGVGR